MIDLGQILKDNKVSVKVGDKFFPVIGLTSNDPDKEGANVIICGASKSIRNEYDDGVCPMCGEEIPLDAVDGGNCAHCPYIFAFFKSVDDAPKSVFVIGGMDKGDDDEEDELRLTPQGHWALMMRSNILRESLKFESAWKALEHLATIKPPSKPYTVMPLFIEEWEMPSGDLLRVVSI